MNLPAEWRKPAGASAPLLRLCSDGHVEFMGPAGSPEGEFIAASRSEFAAFLADAKAGRYDDLAGIEASPLDEAAIRADERQRCAAVLRAKAAEFTASHPDLAVTYADAAELIEGAS